MYPSIIYFLVHNHTYILFNTSQCVNKNQPNPPCIQCIVLHISTTWVKKSTSLLFPEQSDGEVCSLENLWNIYLWSTSSETARIIMIPRIGEKALNWVRAWPIFRKQNSNWWQIIWLELNNDQDLINVCWIPYLYEGPGFGDKQRLASFRVMQMDRPNEQMNMIMDCVVELDRWHDKLGKCQRECSARQCIIMRD